MATIFGRIGVEGPEFTVLARHAEYEVRQYAKQLRAEYEYSMSANAGVTDGLNQPFGKLAGFIFGKNTAVAATSAEKIAMTAPVVTQVASEKIAMTAPVVTTEQTGAGSDKSMRRMAFILPSKYTTLDQVPKPLDATVHVVEHPPFQAAAIKFSGVMTHGAAQKKEAELREFCKRDGVPLSAEGGAVQYCQFNPPWTLPFLRTNEILIPVQA